MIEEDAYFVDDYRIQRFVRTAGSILSSENTPDNIKKEIRWRLKNILLQCSAIDSNNEFDLKGAVLDMMEQAFWIGRYAPAASLAAFIESLNQSERAKRRSRRSATVPEVGWRALARPLAFRLALKEKTYSANSLGEAVIAAWADQLPSPPSGKTMALYMAKLAAEPDCPFSLAVDGRAKKVRN